MSLKKKIKKNAFLYPAARFFFWKCKEIKEKALGTKNQEHYWEKRHFLIEGDWGKKEDWVVSYWNSRFHPHREVLIEKILQYPFDSVLEIGSNCGPNLYLLAQKRPEAKLVGIDINKKAVKAGNEFFKKEGMENARIENLRADELSSFKDKSFDIVFTDAVLLYVGPDKIKKVASEMNRIAKKAIIILEHHSEEESLEGKYNKGNWLRNYARLFQPYAESIKVVKISPELWGGDWGRLGNIIEIVLSS